MKLAYILVLLTFTVINTPVQSSEKRSVTYQQVLSELEEIARNEFEPSKVYQNDFAQLVKTHRISSDKNNYRDFVRVRLAFEATRDSGLWQIRWAVTDREPESDAIWSQWGKQTAPVYLDEGVAQATAIAECDELSALFAFVTRGLGVKKVGLFWPTPNHTVAVWTSVDKAGKPVRIVIPTSQIYIGKDETLGTRAFDPSKQRTIYDYDRRDVALTHKIPAKLARMMIEQVKKHGGKSAAFLQARRNSLSRKFDGS